MARSLCDRLVTFSAILGIYCGISVFIVFTFYYHNNHVGAWALMSGMFSAICLHLKLLKGNGRLSGWYSPGQLHSLAAFGFIFFCISLGFLSWYIIYATYHHIPMLPAGESFYLAAVWAGVTAKWSITTCIISYRYARFLRYSTPFLVIQDNSDNA